MAFSISMTTRMERETVEAERVAVEVELKMEQPREGKSVLQRWKCV